MLQINVDAYYDAIPISEYLRNRFVVKADCTGMYYRLCTLPNSARWSVAVGQAATNTIAGIGTPATMFSLADHILIAARESGSRLHSATRRILQRIRQANLLTTPITQCLDGRGAPPAQKPIPW